MHCMNLISCHPREALRCHIPSIGNGEAAFAAITLLTTPHCVKVVLRKLNFFKACLDVCFVKGG